jgi:RNA polymerase sigma factor (sigma-70 family)
MMAPDLKRAEDADVDDGLIKRIAQGDSNAFLRLFHRYSPTAMGLAWGMLRDRHLAEEIVQEAFLAVWRHPDNYRAERGSVRAWLLSTVHHRAVDLVRQENAQRRRTIDAASVVSTARGPADPAELVVEEIGLADDRKAVRRALADLSPEQRQIIELMYFEGLSQARIAERLPLPMGTVKSRARLAMRRLGASLGGLERTGERNHPLQASS